MKQDGFKDKVVSVRVPRDSGRRVSIFLEPRSGDARAQSAWNVDDMAERVSLTTKTNASLYSREDLLDMGIEWVGDVVQGGLTRVAPKTMRLDKDCVAVLNGGPETVMLKTLTIDDVASIEVYPPSMVQSQRALMMNRPPSKMVGKKGVADSRVVLPFQNTERAGMQNGAMQCAVVYVWTR